MSSLKSEAMCRLRRADVADVDVVIVIVFVDADTPAASGSSLDASDWIGVWSSLA